MYISTKPFGLFDCPSSDDSTVGLPGINFSFVCILNLLMINELGQICRRIIENILQLY